MPLQRLSLRAVSRLVVSNGRRSAAPVACAPVVWHQPSNFSSVAREKDDPSLWVGSKYPDVEPLKNITLPEYAFEEVAKWEDAVAFECGLSGRKYTYKQLYQMSRNFGASLLRAGFKKGDVLATIMPNSPEFPITAFGTWWAGMTLTTVNPMYTPGEIGTQLKDCAAKCIVTISLLVPLAQQVVQSQSSLAQTKIIVIGEEVEDGCHSFLDMARADCAGVKLATSSEIDTENDVAALLYSSGTTGLPKGCMLTHSSLTNNIHQFIPVLTTLTPFSQGNPQGKALGLLPFFHIMGFQSFNLTTLRFGGHVVCMPAFSPDLFCSILSQHKFTSLHLVTPLISFVLDSPELTSKHFEACENIFSGGCPSGKALIQRLLEKIGHDVNFQEGYGMTELSPISHSTLPEYKNKKIGSIGVPVPSTLAKVVCTESGKTVGANFQGEICVKGPQVMKGYLNNEKATKDTIDEDGWLHTGDIGYYDEEQHFYVVDRLKELIKVKGMQVAPSELEALLREHPKISDAAVIGIPHPEWGEKPRAFVVRKDNSLSADEVANYVRDRSAKHKHLAGGVEFIQQVPKAISGKILRRNLKDEYVK